MNKMIVRSVLPLFFLAQAIIAFPAWALECPLDKNYNISINVGAINIDNTVFAPNSDIYVKLADINTGVSAKVTCSSGNDGSDWWGWVSSNAGTQSDSWTTHGAPLQGTTYTYNRGFWPTTIPGIYYTVYVPGGSDGVYLPSSTSATRMMDVNMNLKEYMLMNIYVEIWQRGIVTAVGDATPTSGGLSGTIRAGDSGNPLLNINVSSSSFTVKFKTPTCNLSVSPSTIDFGDVGNDKPRKSFTLSNTGCVNTSGVTLKLKSTKAIYDNSGLSILANTTTGNSAAGGRGVAVSYEDGSPRKYLSANDASSSVTINFGSIVTAKDIPMAGLLTCTSASNNGTCDDYTPGAFTASGIISATYK
ncbi:pilus assembly protein FimA [Citrobacter sp. Igbk 17]|uniref:pilus assembly protein FimA n=1 Tax=Citrobacter sp. Igbk 17 TaxID=2963957 RepID=UPI002304BE5C|nr:pilus assembly protein FimA [Citrobacter sp. Igbk 17]MDA8498792.1 pilus assembly protein FimA [Citrobacter sp. Igbk 17]